MSDIKVGSPEYKHLLRRHSEIKTKFAERGFITMSEFAEFRSLCEQLEKAELAHGEARGEAGEIV